MTVMTHSDIHLSFLKKKIIHFDMDCFFAAVEIRDHPEFNGKPLIVGGSPNSRGVVSTCSYEARKYGIHSAMASVHAYKLCPQAIFIRGNFEKYREVSKQIREIFKRYTDLIEPLSLDEAYLDVTGHELYATEIAKKLKEEIKREVGLTGSAGVAPNKLVAKIASDMHKPDGLTVVRPHQVLHFMGLLSLRKINGIGPVTEKKLLNHQLKFCSDIWKFPLDELEDVLGSRLGAWLYKRSRGIDERPVVTTHVRKSLGTEDTFPKDLIKMEDIEREIERIAKELSQHLQKRNLQGRTLTLKVKYFDFKIVTRSFSFSEATHHSEFIRQTARELLQKTEAGKKSIRLLGISMHNLSQFSKTQL
jgi:DNA polymerase-4